MKAKVKATGKIVDGIPIYYGSEGKGYLDVPVDHDIFDRYDIEEVELLEQPPLPEGLEEAAKEYTDWKSWAKENYLTPYIREAFIAGAEWMKAKMMEKTISWLKDNANKYIVDIGVGYGEKGRNVELVVGGKCWDDLKKAMEDEK